MNKVVNIITKTLKNIIPFYTVFILSCCSLGSKNEAVIYTLRPNISSNVQSVCKTKLNLQIIEPSVAPGLEDRHIAILQKDNRLNYYNNVRWAAPASQMLQNAFVDSFEKYFPSASISTDMDAVSPDFILTTEIRDFQINEINNPYVQIRFVTKLISTKDHRIIATMPVENNITPAVNKMDNIVASFDEATANAIETLLDKTRASLPACSK